MEDPTVIIFTTQEQRQKHIDEEYQYWLQYWKKKFDQETEEVNSYEENN